MSMKEWLVENGLSYRDFADDHGPVAVIDLQEGQWRDSLAAEGLAVSS